MSLGDSSAFPKSSKRQRSRIPLHVMFLALLLFSLSWHCLISIGQSLSQNYVCLYLSPSAYVAQQIGETFGITVQISNVENLHSCGLKITYNTSLLDVMQVVRGSFFPEQAAFEFEKNESYGFVTVNMSLSESDTPLSGNGTLVQLTFQVTQAPTTCTASVLKLNQVWLYNPGMEPIDHKSVSAIYFWRLMQPDPPGAEAMLDLYTQKGGEGLGKPGGIFSTGGLVHLTSHITYRDWPEQNVLVAFQVQNPMNETVAILFGATDEEGFSGVYLRIPEVLESIGRWTAISTASIADEVVWDIISFQVSYAPVGGYTLPVEVHETEKLSTSYLMLVTILTAVFLVVRRKTFGKTKR